VILVSLITSALTFPFEVFHFDDKKLVNKLFSDDKAFDEYHPDYIFVLLIFLIK